MRAVASGLCILAFACNGGARNGAGNGACRQAFAEYQRTWKIALAEDVADMPDLSKELGEKMTETLPTRDVLRKMRDMHTLGLAPGTKESPAWVAAYAAAERGIELCGEGGP